MDAIKSQNKKIISAYDVHIGCSLTCPPEEDKTKQSFGNETNINHIMAQYEKTGLIPNSNQNQGSYGVASSFDFQQAQNTIILAQNMFNALPAKIRSVFDNRPENMLAFMDNPENAAESLRLGLTQAAEGVSEGITSLAPEVATTPFKTPPIRGDNLEPPL